MRNVSVREQRRRHKQTNKQNKSFFKLVLSRQIQTASSLCFAIQSKVEDGERERERPHIELLTKSNEHLDL